MPGSSNSSSPGHEGANPGEQKSTSIPNVLSSTRRREAITVFGTDIRPRHPLPMVRGARHAQFSPFISSCRSRALRVTATPMKIRKPTVPIPSTSQPAKTQTDGRAVSDEVADTLGNPSESSNSPHHQLNAEKGSSTPPNSHEMRSFLMVRGESSTRLEPQVPPLRIRSDHTVSQPEEVQTSDRCPVDTSSTPTRANQGNVVDSVANRSADDIEISNAPQEPPRTPANDDDDDSILDPTRKLSMELGEDKNNQSSHEEYWLDKVDVFTEGELRSINCCQLSCFQNADFTKFIQSAKAVVSKSSSMRRAILNNLRTSDGSYQFNGNRVCERFLKIGFNRSTFTNPPSIARSEDDDSDDSGPHSFSTDGDHTDVPLQSNPLDAAEEGTAESNPPRSSGEVPAHQESSKGSSACKKRVYRFIKRSPRKATNEKPNRIEQWLKDLNGLTEHKLRRTQCCRQYKCFQKVNFSFYCERAKEILPASPASRRATLNGFRNSDGTYSFDGRHVCVRFLKSAFHFSTHLIANDRKSTVTRVGESTLAITPQSSSNLSGAVDVSTGSASTSSGADGSSHAGPFEQGGVHCAQKTSIVSFLQRLSEDCSDRIPNKPEVHLPFFRRSDVYDHFVNEYHILYPSQAVPTSAYFMRTWRQCVDHIKVRRTHGFTVCDECDQLRRALHSAITKSLPTKDILEKKAKHLEFVKKERLAYALKRDRARLDPESYLSLIVDGADQSAFGIPHFVTTVKSVRGQSLKVKVIGLLHHAVPNDLYLFTMTDDHETGANHIVEAIHRFINNQRSKGPLPRTFFIQADNCTRENKNHFLMAYLESLVALSVFDSIEISFLPKGHTHEDIDQVFSSTSSRLRTHDAATLDDLHHELSQTLGGKTKVSHMRRVINWSGLCREEGCIRKIHAISQYRYFKFSRARTDTEKENDVLPMSAQCHVKRQCNDDWVPARFSTQEGNGRGILRFCPKLENIPSTIIKCPEGKEKFIQRLVSEDGRINCASKMAQLHDLKDHVFKDRIDRPHWDLATIAETKALRSAGVQLDDELDGNKDSSTGNHARHSEDDLIDDSSDEMNAEITDSSNCADETPEPSASDPDSRTEINKQARRKEKARNGGKKQAKNVNRSHRSRTPSTKLSYEVGHFVVVNVDNDADGDSSKTAQDDDSSLPTFWVAKITGLVMEAGEDFVRQLHVHWYDVEKGKQEVISPLDAKYFPSYILSDKRRKVSAFSSKSRPSQVQVAQTDTIDTDTILMTFTSLEKNHTLPVSVQSPLSS